MENAHKPEESLIISPHHSLHLNMLVTFIGGIVTLSFLTALLVFNLEAMSPGLAGELGLTLPYALKLWLVPTSIICLLASGTWTISHLEHR